MEKETLTGFEARCIQEEPAFCTAVCPFHVDVKGFLSHMAVSSRDKAFKILERTLPLPEILARVCDHPCESACIRNAVDEPIAVGDLERACVMSRSRQKKYFAPPAKAACVGIWGSGPSSLVAAWDLSLKGYKVTVFERESSPGGHLKRLSRNILPESVLDGELLRLKGFGVVFQTDAEFSEFEKQKSDFNAVFIGLDAEGGPERPGGIDPFSLGCGKTRVFCGGFSDEGLSVTAKSSPVAFAFQGRKAATSIDRVIAGVSLTAGRDREGPVVTRLSTDVSRILPEPKVVLAPSADGSGNADPSLVAKEAARCHQCDCSRCLRVCSTYLDSFGGFPGRYAREIYNNLSIVMGERKSNTLINSCTLCNLCTTVCPNDFSMADLCLSARQEMVEKDGMPPSAHAFALAELEHALSDACAFRGHARGETRSEVLFFPGCQLTGSAPDQALAAYEWLLKHVNPATGIVAGCCGAPAHWAGRADQTRSVLEDIRTLWEAWDRPRVITACTSCTQMLGRVLPCDQVTSIYEVMADQAPVPAFSLAGKAVAVSDPCTAREDHAVQRAVRKLVAGTGLAIHELAASGTLTECCGFGGLTFNANPEMAKEMITSRAAQGEEDYITYCAMCRDRIARTGKPAHHVLDLFWPGGEDLSGRPDPGFSQRRMNRVGFKEMLTADREESKATFPVSPSGRKIRMAPEVLERLEDQFILYQDILAVFTAFEEDETTGFFHRDRGTRIVSHRSGTVRFWVEFSLAADAYEVRDAWCHRMEVAASKAFAEGKPDPDHDPSVHCHGCGKELVFYKNHVEYLGSRFDVDLPQCPGCGSVYVSPRLSRTRMAEVEHILEDK